MKFELTITGLCVVALKRSDEAEDKPEHPEQIDIIIPRVEGHAARLSYDAADVIPLHDSVKPVMVPDSAGRRLASLDISGQILALDFRTNPAKNSFVNWDGDSEMPSTPWEEFSLNWIPILPDLGFENFNVEETGTLSQEVAAWIRLPKGALGSRSLLVTDDKKEYIVWKFPASGKKRALANDIVYTADHVKNFVVGDASGTPLLKDSGFGAHGTLRMCVSNDDAVVPPDFNTTPIAKALQHLRDFKLLGIGGNFQAPEVFSEEDRTGHPICMSVLNIWPFS
jgi:hypothetical protein